MGCAVRGLRSRPLGLRAHGRVSEEVFEGEPRVPVSSDPSYPPLALLPGLISRGPEGLGIDPCCLRGPWGAWWDPALHLFPLGHKTPTLSTHVGLGQA